MRLLYLYFYLSGMTNEPVMFNNSTEHRLSTTKEEIRSHAVYVTIPVYWNMTPCKLMGEHQNYGDVCCFLPFSGWPKSKLNDHKNGYPVFFTHSGAYVITLLSSYARRRKSAPAQL